MKMGSYYMIYWHRLSSFLLGFDNVKKTEKLGTHMITLNILFFNQNFSFQNSKPIILTDWMTCLFFYIIKTQEESDPSESINHFYLIPYLIHLWQLSVNLMSWLEYKSAVIIDFSLFWFWKIHKCPKK